MAMIFVFGRVTGKDCGQSKATVRRMIRLGLRFQFIEVPESGAVVEELKVAGYKSIPVVSGPTGSWSGFRPEKMKELAEHV